MEKEGKIYFLTDTKNIKIGITSGKISKRIKQLNTGNGNQIYELGFIYGNKDKEKELHKTFSCDRLRYNGEWFFPSERLIDYINKVNEKPNVGVECIDGVVMSLLKISS